MVTASTDTARSELGARMFRLSIAWRQRLDVEFKRRDGLTASKWRPLMALGRLGDGVRQKDLAATLQIECPSLVRLLDDLEQHGLIERREDATDRRAKTLHLTVEGLAAYRRLKEIADRFAARTLAGVSDEEFQVCVDVLDRIEARLNAAEIERAAS